MNNKRKILIIASVALVLVSVTGGLLVYKDNVAKAQAIASATQLEEAKLQLSEVAIQSNLAAQAAKDSKKVPTAELPRINVDAFKSMTLPEIKAQVEIERKRMLEYSRYQLFYCSFGNQSPVILRLSGKGFFTDRVRVSCATLNIEVAF